MEGFLDGTTIEALRLADGCTNSRIKPDLPLTGTMWYDSATGSIHDFGNGKPSHLRTDERVVPVKIVFDDWGFPAPQLARQYRDKKNAALETALGSIKIYRQAKAHPSIY